MEIRLIAFRGLGLRRHKDKPALIKVGHVGLQFEGDPIIYGFHPTEDALEAAGGEEQLIKLLAKNVPQPGMIFDDTEIFELVAELSERGEKTAVYCLTYEFSEEEFQRIKARLLGLYNTRTELIYNFPNEEGQFDKDESNCATFPFMLGIPVPDTGFVSEYIIEMKEKGAKQWK